MTQSGLRRKCGRPGKLTVFTKEHRGSRASLSPGFSLCLGSVREQTDTLQDGCQQPVGLFSQRDDGRWSRGPYEDCTSAVVNISFRYLTCCPQCLTSLGLLSKVDSEVKFLDQDFRGKCFSPAERHPGEPGDQPFPMTG